MPFLKKTLALVLLVAVMLSCVQAELVELNPSNFKSIVENPKKNVFVMFYAPWCGHCNHMKPAWQQLADKYPIDSSDVVIARVDGSAFREMAAKYDVNGFPTLKFFSKSDKSGKVQFTGPREVAAFDSFLKKHVE